ncbi:MAG: response regulator [Puia sp.]|nr:response regulator [Puia sp.]
MILIVDDKPENIFSLKTILELHSFPTDTASSGEEALKKILRNSYALIILDVQMPHMDGFEVAEAISGYSKARDVPIIFLSAVSTDKKFITRGYTSGGTDYITKPIDTDILLLKVKTFYRLYEQNRELNEIQASLRSEIEFRKKVQAEILERANELHSILESIPQIAFTTRADGNIEYVNREWLRYSSSGHAFPSIHPDEEDLALQWGRAVASGEPLELELRMRRKDQEQYRFYLLRAMPVKEGQKIVKWVGTFTDIEDQKEAVRKKDEFISIASHELKTPLTTIKAYVQLLERDMEETNPVKTYVERTLIQVRKLDNLIADLLDISKIESGKLKFNKHSFRFAPILSNAIEMIGQTYADYTIVRKGDAEVDLYGDEIRIEQVILNYLSNAVKYSPDIKEIEIETSVTKDNHLYVAVKDFGIGIGKENQAHIFSKFYRVEDTANRFQGLGIGLYICAEIIRRHQGKYGVESEPGHGSLFYFSIPLKRSAGGNEPTGAAEAPLTNS